MDFATARSNLAPGQTYGMASHGDDTGLYVEFRTESVVDGIKSREEARTVHHDVPYIKIMFPGDKTKVVDRPVKMEDDDTGPSDLNRFSRQWTQFQKQQEQTVDGLPINEWPPISKSQANDLKSMGIHSVEQLSVLPDSALTWLGARELREQAKAWLDKAGAHASATKLASENARLQAQIDAMQEQIKALGAVKADEAKSTKK